VLTVAFLVMKKYIKKHLKDEKRILKLMYKKGIFETLGINLKDLGWEYLLYGKRQRRRKGKNKYAFRECLPELHVYTQDYWGEGDSNSVIGILKDHIYFGDTDIYDYDEEGFPINSKFPKINDVINYLLKLPTKNNDSKFNHLLKRSFEQ
jgi:hypothetical protein